MSFKTFPSISQQIYYIILIKGESQKFLGKHFTMRVCMQNLWEKWDVEMKKKNFSMAFWQ